jgi:hypothetical protein
VSAFFSLSLFVSCEGSDLATKLISFRRSPTKSLYFSYFQINSEGEKAGRPNPTMLLLLLLLLLLSSLW